MTYRQPFLQPNLAYNNYNAEMLMRNNSLRDPGKILQRPHNTKIMELGESVESLMPAADLLGLDDEILNEYEDLGNQLNPVKDKKMDSLGIQIKMNDSDSNVGNEAKSSQELSPTMPISEKTAKEEKKDKKSSRSSDFSRDDTTQGGLSSNNSS